MPCSAASSVGAEGHVVHRARAVVPLPEARHGAQVHDAAERRVAGGEPARVTPSTGPGRKRASRRAAPRWAPRRRARAARRRGRGRRARGGTSCEPSSPAHPASASTRGVADRARGAARPRPRATGSSRWARRPASGKRRLRARVLHAAHDEPLQPPAERRRRHGERRDPHLPGADAPARPERPREHGEDRARRPGSVAEVEVPGARVVEVDRALHQAQPEHAGIEVEGTLRGADDGRDVVDAGRGRDGGGVGGSGSVVGHAGEGHSCRMASMGDRRAARSAG
jgi:hypothetical protein